MSFNYFLQISFWLFLISIPFGFRVLLYQFTPGFHEYESIFLYGSDLFLLAFLFFFYFSDFNHWPFSRILKNLRIVNRPSFFVSWPESIAITLGGARVDNKLRIVSLVAFLVFAGTSIFAATYWVLSLYNFIRLFLLVLFAFAVGKLLKEGFLKLEKILAVLGILTVVESLIAILQFYYQKSLGLWFLGESVLGEGIKSVAKIDVEGGHFLRAYGTFPHPNILAGFLLLGLFSLFYFWLRRPTQGWPFSALRRLFLGDLLIGISLFIVALGLILTFSRAAWLIAIVLSGALIAFLFTNKDYRKQSLRLLILLLAISYLLLAAWGWVIFSRATISLSEPAVSQRLAYNELGFNLLKLKPFGVGMGNQVIYSVQNNLYKNLGMNESWQWQPIHNIYFLIGVEIGILGLFVFLIFLSLFLISKSKFLISKQYQNPNIQNKNLFRNSDLEIRICQLMLLALLGFGFFDHFLWTLQPGRLMFWVVIGLVLGI